MENVFEEILENCKNKNVQGICKKLNVKFSVKRGKDIEKLCHLIYWLFFLYDILLA
jgi:hypothetical protein